MSSELRKILHHLGKSGFLKSGKRVKRAESPDYTNRAIPNKAQFVPRYVPFAGTERKGALPPNVGTMQQRFEADPVGQTARLQGQKTAPFANFIYNLMTYFGTNPTYDNTSVDDAVFNNTVIPLREPPSKGYAGASPAAIQQVAKRTAQQAEDFRNVEHVGDWVNTIAGNADTHPIANWVVPITTMAGPGGAAKIGGNVVKGVATPSKYLPMFAKGMGMATAYNAGKNMPSTLGGLNSGEMGMDDALWNMAQGMPGTRLGPVLLQSRYASRPQHFMLAYPEEWLSMSDSERQQFLSGGPTWGDIGNAALDEFIQPAMFGLMAGPGGKPAFTPRVQPLEAPGRAAGRPRGGFIRFPISGSGQYGRSETNDQLAFIRRWYPEAPEPPRVPQRGAEVTAENATAMNDYLLQYGPEAEARYSAANGGNSSNINWNFPADAAYPSTQSAPQPQPGSQPQPAAPQPATPRPAQAPAQAADPNAPVRLTVDEYANILRTMNGNTPPAETPAPNEPSPQQRVADFWRSVRANPDASHYDAAVELMVDPATRPIFKQSWPGQGSYLRPFWYWSMPNAGEQGAFDRVMRHNMSVGQHPYWHGGGDAALWTTVGTGVPLGTALMLGGLGGGDGAGEYDSTGGGIDDTETPSDGAGVGETETAKHDPMDEPIPREEKVRKFRVGPRKKSAPASTKAPGT